MGGDRIAVMGAGAVGCYHGAMLAAAGEQVVLIGRPRLVQAVRDSGLTLEKDGRRQIFRLEAADDAVAAAGAGLVLVCVKSADTRAAAEALALHLDPETVVLSLQNGIGNAAVLSEVLGRPVIPAVVYVAVQMTGDGHVLHRGGGRLVIGDTAAAKAVAVRMSRAGIPTDVSPSVETELWSKLTLNCSLNAVSALTRRPYAAIYAANGAEALLRGVVEECRAVALAEGVVLPVDIWQQVLHIVDIMPEQMSSTAQDLMRGKPTEIDYINGEIVRRAAKHAIPVPLNNALTVMVSLSEQAGGAATS